MKKCCWNIFLLIIVIFIMITNSGCSSGGGSDSSPIPTPTSTPTPTPTNSINPSNSNALTSALVVPGATNVSGEMPASSDDTNAPSISRSEENVSYSSGSQMLLPFDYQANNSGSISYLIFAVEGADSYFEIDLSDTGSTGTVVLPINIPDEIEDGQFCIDAKLIDSNNLISVEQTICITVVQPLACGTVKVSGGEGVREPQQNKLPNFPT